MLDRLFQCRRYFHQLAYGHCFGGYQLIELFHTGTELLPESQPGLSLLLGQLLRPLPIFLASDVMARGPNTPALAQAVKESTMYTADILGTEDIGQISRYRGETTAVHGEDNHRGGVEINQPDH